MLSKKSLKNILDQHLKEFKRCQAIYQQKRRQEKQFIEQEQQSSLNDSWHRSQIFNHKPQKLSQQQQENQKMQEEQNQVHIPEYQDIFNPLTQKQHATPINQTPEQIESKQQEERWKKIIIYENSNLMVDFLQSVENLSKNFNKDELQVQVQLAQAQQGTLSKEDILIKKEIQNQ